MNWTKKEYDRIYYLNNPKKHYNPEKGREWRRANVEQTLTNSARRRAKEKNLPFNITYLDITVPTHCPILGVPLQPNQTGDKRHRKNSPSLDRIIPELGYVVGNVQVISHLANTMKQNATSEELIAFARWVLREYT